MGNFRSSVYPIPCCQFPIRTDFHDHGINIFLLDQGNPAIILGVISSTQWLVINDQPGYQVLDEGIGGMVGGEL